MIDRFKNLRYYNAPEYDNYTLVDWANVFGYEWVNILSHDSSFDDKCKYWYKLTGTHWAMLFRYRPELIDNCAWNMLNSSGCFEILSRHPQLIDKACLDVLECDHWIELLKLHQFTTSQLSRCPWNTFDSDHWANLLMHKPEFSSRCPWRDLKGSAWMKILCVQPQFVNRCIGLNAWRKFRSDDWCMLLVYQPQFQNKCPWANLNVNHVARLLNDRPQFIDRCQWDKTSAHLLTFMRSDRFRLSERDLPRIVRTYPGLEKYLSAQ